MNNYLDTFEEETDSPPYGVLVADYFHREYGFNGHRSTGTKDWLLIYTVSGEGQFRVTHDVQTCCAGDVTILAPGVPHHYATSPNQQWELLWVHFVPMPEWLEWLRLPRTTEHLIYLTIQDSQTRVRIQEAFLRLIQDSSRGGISYRQLALFALAEILILIHAEHLKMNEPPSDERVARILQYLSDNLHQSHQLSDLANMFNLSVSRMCHLFKDQVGDSIIAVLLKMRLHKAAKLLEYTGRHIHEISSDVGFESPYYFSRTFSAHYGCSPSDYRNNTRVKWK